MAKQRTAAAKRRESVLYAGLSSHLAKLSVRSDLKDGASYGLHATIVGRVNSEPQIETVISGTLTVGHPMTQNRSVVAPVEQIVACLLEQIPKNRRAAVLASLAGQYLENDHQLTGMKSLVEDAKSWLQQLRSTRSVERNGSVSFRVES